MSLIKFLNVEVPVEELKREVFDNSRNWEIASELRGKTIFVNKERKPLSFVPLVKGCTHNPNEIWNDLNVERTIFYDNYPILTSWLNSNFKNLARIWLFRNFGEELTIRPHVDGGDYYEKVNRHHLCIKGKYIYQVGTEVVTVKEGDVFWFNNQVMHAGFNKCEERIIVVFDTIKIGENGEAPIISSSPNLTEK